MCTKEIKVNQIKADTLDELKEELNKISLTSEENIISIYTIIITTKNLSDIVQTAD